MSEATTISANKQITCTFLKLELPLKNALLAQAEPQKTIFFSHPSRTQDPAGILRFKPMSAIANTQEISIPLVVNPAEDGRFRLFWLGRHVGGLWDSHEVAQAEAAAPQSFEELIEVLDCVVAKSENP